MRLFQSSRFVTISTIIVFVIMEVINTLLVAQRMKLCAQCGGQHLSQSNLRPRF